MSTRSDDRPLPGLASLPARPEANAPNPTGSWLNDLELRGRTLVIRKTGATVRFDTALVREIGRGLRIVLLLMARRWWLRGTGRERRRVWFAPDDPRPWYMVHAALSYAGVAVAHRPEEACAAMFFDDATRSPPLARPDGVALNHGCHDISKSRVGEAFAAAFGYALAIDPRAHVGPAVRKSEINSRHDGRVIECPCDPVAGTVVQRLVDTGDDTHVLDLRTQVVGGRPVAVYPKRRPQADRFRSISNVEVSLVDPATVFSDEECAAIGRFCAAMGLDWGTLDVLRDRQDGRLYVVDANKTDVGPMLSLPLLEQVRSIRLASEALVALLPEELHLRISRLAAIRGAD